MEFFAAYQAAKPGSPLYEGALTIYPPDRFEWDAKHDRLPTVSWIVPTSGQSEHPAYLPASGANYLASKLNAVAENRDLWSKTVFIVNYDENDGLFDHVAPPLPPAGTAGEFVQVGTSPNWPIGGGIRVPAFVISPWSVGGFVATEQFDHTSVLQFLERLTGVTETNITAWRRQTFGDLTSALGFSNGKATSFPRTLPNTIGEFWEAEQEVATLPAPTVPTTNQTPPVQEKRRPRLPWTPQPRQRHENDDTVSVIDTASQTVTSTIPLGSGTTTDTSGTTKGTTFTQLNHQPTAIELSPDGKNIWIACNTSSSLVVISTSSNTVVDSTDIGLGDDPTGIAFA